MSFKILYVTATDSESEGIRKMLEMKQAPELPGNLDISFLVTGVGAVPTAWSLQHWIAVNGKPDLAVNGGIAGSFSYQISIGDVVMPVSDCFADAGIEDRGNFITLFESGLAGTDEFPFRNGLLHADSSYIEMLRAGFKPVRAVTVNTATGSENTRVRLMKKFNPEIETMEGATFFYICCREKIPFLAIRAISNRVEARDIKKWNISLALNNLSEKTMEILLMLQKKI
jgi:futalosine hydrolase